ncbi:hypothetical protein Ancab_031353 [Ancistrocladus abbreviatus]
MASLSGACSCMFKVWRCTLMLLCCNFMFHAVARTTHPNEVSALQAVKSSLFDPMNRLKNWNEGDPCKSSWRGVFCFDNVGTDGYFHVKELQLLNMNLSGTLAPELGQLSQLWILDFMWNQISGSIPKEIGNISSLKLLLLNGNKLSGFLPDELGQLSNLNRLQLDANNISGSLPMSFANLTNLKHMHLNNNSISGQLPAELSKLPMLLHLLLDNNNLSGTLPPEYSQLAEMRILQLDNNQFDSAEIPDTYRNLPQLVKLSLRNCSLVGVMPDLSQIPNLSFVDLSWNQLAGHIPSNKLSDNMTTIYLSHNHLNGSIPDSFSGLPALQILSLENNFLTGSIPTGIWENKSFNSSATLVVDLRYNLLTNISSELNPSQNVTLSYESSADGAIKVVMRSLKKLWLIDFSLANTWSAAQLIFLAHFVLLHLGSDTAAHIIAQLNFLSATLHHCSALVASLKAQTPRFDVLLLYISLLELVVRWFQGNPVCNRANIDGIQQFCESDAGGNETSFPSDCSTNPAIECPAQACPTYYEYVPAQNKCFCSAPILIGYRLKSPSFSYFPPYIHAFEVYITSYFDLDPYCLLIDSCDWEEGRLRMYLKLFPSISYGHQFNDSEAYLVSSFPVILDTGNTGISKGVLAAILTVVICVAVTSFAIVILLILRRNNKYQHTLWRKHLSSIKIDGVKEFTFKELALATDNFDSSTQVGQGGYGKVYKGILSNNTLVAVKRAEEGSLQGTREFLTEIELLSRLHHRNLVSLVGYCGEAGEQMLVYEFMSNGTLRDWISGKREGTLNFGMRLRIALGSAKGILYLHAEANPPIFHRDIKASNILLDTNMTAKVADFGLSRFAPLLDDEGTTSDHVSTVVKGTPGYLDPEYFLTHKLSDKSDVYSLGVVFLELLTGLQPIVHGKNLVREVYVAHQLGTTFSIIDSRMGAYPSNCLERFIALALGCCDDEMEKRPSMLDVVRELENILQMLPESITISKATSSYSESSSRPSSMPNVTRYTHTSSDISGSDLTTGIMSISPR